MIENFWNIVLTGLGGGVVLAVIILLVRRNL